MDYVNLDEINTTLADFDILSIIDRSSDYSTVYKALDKRSGRIIALKMINIVDQKDISTLIRAMQQKQRQWKHVCQVFNCFGEDGKVFIEMEYFAGGSIKDLLQQIQESEVQNELVSLILKQIVLAVNEIHSYNLVHRQIKCANILLSQDGQVKLSYFAPDQQFSETLHKSKSHIISLPYWLAPETIQNSQFDQKSDIWALGITAYELITGKQPFEGIPPQKAIFVIAYNPPPHLPTSYNKICQDFIEKCLQKDPKARADAKSLLEHPLLSRAGKIQLQFELFENKHIARPLSAHKEATENKYMHKRVRTSFRVNSKGVLVADVTQSNELSPIHSNANIQQFTSGIKEEENETSDHPNLLQCNKVIKENEESDSALVSLSIKRTIRKIEKYKPGLTKIIFQEIIHAYKDMEPSDFKQYFS